MEAHAAITIKANSVAIVMSWEINRDSLGKIMDINH